MIPIQQLLARIRHDPAFGKGLYEFGYFDRVEGTIHRVEFREITWTGCRRQTFEVLDESGRVRRIPFHRIREVYRDGHLIWQRPLSG